ncbi:MAG TPA: helix-turn-helix domain-containing protein [Kineosporiaceae bacterium]
MTTTFGERLRSLRLEAGLSQQALASDEVSASYVSLLEAGKRTPRSEVVHHLAARLGCSTTRLLEGQPSEREQIIDLELAYARLAIEHGESADAAARLRRLLEQDPDAIPQKIRDDICVLLATAHERQGELESALTLLAPLFERALRGEPAPTHIVITDLAVQLTRVYVGVGDVGQAIDIGLRALDSAKAQRLGGTTDYYRLAATVMGAFIVRGDWATATQMCDEYLAEAVGAGEYHGQAALLWNAAVLAQHQGQLARGLGIAERAVGLLSELEGARDYARLRLAIASLLLSVDPPDSLRAGEFLRRCQADLQDMGTPTDLVRWHALMAQVLLLESDLEEAGVRARQAVELAASKRLAPSTQAEALVALSDALATRGREYLEPLLRALAQLETAAPSLTRWDAQQVRDVAERLAPVDPTAAVRAFRLAVQCAVVPDRSAPLRARVRALAASAGNAAVMPTAAADARIATNAVKVD